MGGCKINHVANQWPRVFGSLAHHLIYVFPHLVTLSVCYPIKKQRQFGCTRWLHTAILVQSNESSMLPPSALRLTRRCTRRDAVRWPGGRAASCSPARRCHGSCSSLLPSCIVGRGNCRAASALVREGAAPVSGRYVSRAQPKPTNNVLRIDDWTSIDGHWRGAAGNRRRPSALATARFTPDHRHGRQVPGTARLRPFGR